MLTVNVLSRKEAVDLKSNLDPESQIYLIKRTPYY